MKNRNYRLVEAIDKKGMTQGGLARTMGCSETHISRLILGYTQPTREEIAVICKILKSTPTQLGLESNR